MFGKLFISSFLGFAIIYAFIAAFTSYFYRGKSAFDLSMLESKILHGEARFKDRMKIFFMTIFASYAYIPIYILAGITSLILYLIVK